MSSPQLSWFFRWDVASVSTSVARTIGSALWMLSAGWCGWAQGDQPVDFNEQVRPIFNQHCVACHGGVKQAAGLSFVYPDDASYIVEPGDPDASLLIERVAAEDPEERMPPVDHGPGLSPAEIETLREWIAAGAEWGQHWSFVPPRRSPLPEVSNPQWCRVPIDRFILWRLEQSGLRPNPDMPADRWLRKVALDLTGLPPSPEQRERFLQDVAQRGELAFASAVDRLLDSPAYGERWASVWLDVMRYADSKGLGQDGRRTIWKYRDWVIRALNNDLPYDAFTRQQIAGDLLPDATMEDLVATACHRLTQTNEEGGTDDEQFRVEAVIDRINTTWLAWQGLSFGCVQCHSHPYDPIRHDEYYRFMAFFNNTVDCDLESDEPRVAVPMDLADYGRARVLDRQIERLQEELWRDEFSLLTDADLWRPVVEMEARSSNQTRVVTQVVDGVAEYRTQGTVAQRPTITLEFPLPPGVDRVTAVRFTGLPRNEERARIDSEWGWVLSHVRLELVLGDGAAEELKIAWVVADEPHPLLDPQESLNPKSNDGFGPYSRIHYPRRAALVLAEPVSVPAGSKLRLSLAQKHVALGAFPLVAHRGRVDVSGEDRWTQWLGGPLRLQRLQQIEDLRKERGRIRSVPTPVLRERPEHLARPTHVFDRGNFLTKTEAVEANVPEFLPPLRTAEGDGRPTRLDLAEWIVSPENPLTARVAVNRFWSRLFGVGLVETEEDFGAAGAAPSHPMLLDDLAIRFQTDMGWSVKTLLRELVLSSTYRQSPQVTPEKVANDPRNRLLSRGARLRLPAEIIRDQALAIGGLLSDEQFGPPAYPPIPEGVWMPFQGSDKWETPGRDSSGRYRRTVYTYTKRSIPYPVMAAFDAPTREFCAVRRLPSNTPIQALMTLNDATFVEAAEGLAGRMENHPGPLVEQLRYGFLVATCREPDADELARLQTLFEHLEPPATESERQESAAPGPDRRMQVVASVLLNLDEVLTH